MLPLQVFGLVGRHDGILEEAAGVADHRRIGKFAPTDPDHCLGHVAKGRRGDAHRGEFFRDASVIEFQCALPRQCEFNRGDDIAVW